MSFSRSLKERAARVWEDGYGHPFVQELGSGVLDREKFKFYLLQDYQYLLSYAKVFALGALKSGSEYLMSRFSASQDAILNREMNIHREYMSAFGVTREEMERARPSLFNRAYTANMLALGYSGGACEIIAAVFPCAWTYSDYARRLAADYRGALAGNFYRPWIEGYASDEFAASSVEFEYLFWDMSYKRQMSYA